MLPGLERTYNYLVPKYDLMGSVSPKETFTECIDLTQLNPDVNFNNLIQSKLNRLLSLKKKCTRILLEYLLDKKFKNSFEYNTFLFQLKYEFDKDSDRYSVYLFNEKKKTFLYSDVENRLTNLVPEDNSGKMKITIGWQPKF